MRKGQMSNYDSVTGLINIAKVTKKKSGPKDRPQIWYALGGLWKFAEIPVQEPSDGSPGQGRDPEQP
jgi:hypothetical protein